jgi:hypothetical protein
MQMGVPMHVCNSVPWHATSAPMEQNAGSAPLAGAASTQGAHLHHCNSQGSPSEAADPSSHGQRALRHELNEPSHTGSPASPDTLEVVFASNSPSVLCNFLLEQADGGNEECKKELDRILAAVASRNLCANSNVPDVHAGSDENQPSNKRPRRKETHARVNSQDLCQKAFMQRHYALMSLISCKDASMEGQHGAMIRHFRVCIKQSNTALLRVCHTRALHAATCYSGTVSDCVDMWVFSSRLMQFIICM